MRATRITHPSVLLATAVLALDNPIPKGAGLLPWSSRLAGLLSALACLATTGCHDRILRNYPAWRSPTVEERLVGCARVQAWVNKTGKEGLGVAVVSWPASQQADARCVATVLEAAFVLAGHDPVVSAPTAVSPAPLAVPAGSALAGQLEVAPGLPRSSGACPLASYGRPAPLSLPLAPAGASHVYLPFAFDNESAWNDG